jgi:hypothetical protein
MECFIGFSVSNQKFPIIGRLIQLLQRNKFSHTWMAIYLRSVQRWFVIDATAKGVKIHTMENFQRNHRLVKKYALEVTEDQKKSIMLTAIEKSYVHYSVLEIIGNLIQLVTGIRKNIFGQGIHFTRCNELIGEILRDNLGHNIEEDLDGTDLLWLDEYLKRNLP